MNLLRKIEKSSTGGMVLMFVFLTLLASCCTTGAYADEREKRLIWAGLDLFPSLLAADMDIADKQTSDGELLLVLAYADDRASAVEMASYLEKIKRIRNIPIHIEVRRSDFLAKSAGSLPAGIFLTQRMDYHLPAIIRYGIKNHIIVFSPFESDVERGVLGGIVVRERILPYINVTTMNHSDIHFKPFFLRIAKRYE